MQQEKEKELYDNKIFTLYIAGFTGKSFLGLFGFRQAVKENDASDSSDTEDKEQLGDKLFSLVEKLDPLRANDITGEVIHTIQYHTIPYHTTPPLFI